MASDRLSVAVASMAAEDIRLPIRRLYRYIYSFTAMDATRIQMWMDIKKGLYEDFIDPQIVRDENLQPFDIPKEVYDKYSVVLKVEDIPGDYENILIVIEDDGIGMEKDCISVISTIGTGWRGRKKYDRIIKEMPRPAVLESEFSLHLW